jgi:hypothetical protein
MMTAEKGTAAAAAAAAESQQKATTSKKNPQAKKMKAIKATNKNKVCRANQVTKIKERTPNFLVSEDVALCKAYVNGTLNPLIGGIPLLHLPCDCPLESASNGSRFSLNKEYIIFLCTFAIVLCTFAI